MEIRQQYLQKYLHDIALDQLAADYTAKNYQVTREEHFDQNHQADLVARKGDEVIVVEVKTGKLTADRRKKLAQLGDYARTKNYKFLVVIATPPKPKRIDVPELDQLLLDYLIDHFPDELSALSSRTRITDVLGGTTDEIQVQQDGRVRAKGSGVLSVSLSSGPQNDSVESVETFPFTFDVTLDRVSGKELMIETMNDLAIDTSDFYE